MTSSEVARLVHAEVQRQVAAVLRQANNNSRPSFFYGITNGDIERGATGGAVSIYYWNIETQDWEDSLRDMEDVRTFFPNIGEIVPGDTAVRVEWYETTWVISNWYCDVADWN